MTICGTDRYRGAKGQGKEINNQNGTKLIIKRASIEINRTHCGRFYLGRGRSFSGCGNRKENFNRKKAGKEDDTENTHFILQRSDCMPLINALGVYMKNILCKLIMKFTQLKKYGKQRIAPVRQNNLREEGEGEGWKNRHFKFPKRVKTLPKGINYRKIQNIGFQKHLKILWYRLIHGKLESQNFAGSSFAPHI